MLVNSGPVVISLNYGFPALHSAQNNFLRDFDVRTETCGTVQHMNTRICEMWILFNNFYFQRAIPGTSSSKLKEVSDQPATNDVNENVKKEEVSEDEDEVDIDDI